MGPETWGLPDKIEIPTEQWENNVKTVITSVLGSLRAARGGQEFEFANEIDIQRLVRALVEDAIKCLGYEFRLNVFEEMSLFSLVPDVVVVRKRGRVFFVVEVKSPEQRDGQVFESKFVAGQVHSYLMAMKAQGREMPVAAVCTYDKCVISTLHQPPKKDHEGFLEQAQQALSKKRVVVRAPELDTEQKERSSPEKHVKSIVSYHLRGVAGEEDSQVGPEVVYSQVFESRRVFAALLLALKAADHYSREENDSSVPCSVPSVKTGDSLSGLLFATVDGNSCNWVTVGKGVKANCDSFPLPQAKKFYLLGSLGSGRTGKVFLASTMSGRVCAIKLHIPERPTNVLPEHREEKLMRMSRECKERRDVEHKRWKTLYPGLPCRQETINALPALLLQYGRPVAREERKGCLAAVEKELSRFADAGFAYNNSDLRWRHVSKNRKGEVFLLDLESLDEICPLEARSLVKDHIQQLRTRMELEENYTGTGEAAFANYFG